MRGRRTTFPHYTLPDDVGQGHRDETKRATNDHVSDAFLRNAAGAAGKGCGHRTEAGERRQQFTVWSDSRATASLSSPDSKSGHDTIVAAARVNPHR